MKLRRGKNTTSASTVILHDGDISNMALLQRVVIDCVIFQRAGRSAPSSVIVLSPSRIGHGDVLVTLYPQSDCPSLLLDTSVT